MPSGKSAASFSVPEESMVGGGEGGGAGVSLSFLQELMITVLINKIFINR